MVQRIRKNAVPDYETDMAEESYTLFSTIFRGQYYEHIWADNGVDTNTMDDVTLPCICCSWADLSVQGLAQPRGFDMTSDASDAKPAKLLCSKEVVFDTKLYMRHSVALKSRNAAWPVTSQRVSKPLSGRFILEGLGLNTLEILATAADRFVSTADLECLLGTVDQHRAGRVSLVLEEIFHADNQRIEEEKNEITDLYWNIGKESDAYW